MVSLAKSSYKNKLRKFGLRVTSARLAVINFLEASREPVDVGQIINYLNQKAIKTDPVTVFRIINTFTKKGITTQVQFREGKARYELKSKGDHHHLICESCGDIEDISNCEIAKLENKIKEKKKFLVNSHSLEFFGLCSNCSSRSEAGQ